MKRDLTLPFSKKKKKIEKEAEGKLFEKERKQLLVNIYHWNTDYRKPSTECIHTEIWKFYDGKLHLCRENSEYAFSLGITFCFPSAVNPPAFTQIVPCHLCHFDSEETLLMQFHIWRRG